MKYSLVALAATSIFGGASARNHHHLHRRHNHAYNSNLTETCVPQCTTYVTSYLVDYTPPPPPPSSPSTVIVVPVPEHTSSVPVTYSPKTHTPVTYAPIVTPAVTTCPTPGVYTIPASTVTLSSTSYLCVPTTTSLCPGEHTVGGVTTVVESKTTVTCPIPTVETSAGVTTTKVYLTTYVCPTPGTYTISPTTITVTDTTTVPCEIPSVTSYPPGVYTAPDVTTTITETNKVVTCPLYSSTSTVEVVPVAPTPTPYKHEKPKSTEAPEEHPTTYEKPEEHPTTYAKPTSVTPVPYVAKTTKAPAPQSTKVSHNYGNDNNDYIPKDKIWAITYSPYNDDSTCKSAEDVDADVKDIAYKGFKAIRLYSTDCDGLKTVGESCGKHGLKIVIGVFIKSGGVHTADSQVDDIIAWNRWDLIDMFVVGNEAVFQQFCSASELATYISDVKSKLRTAGYNGPVTTTEPLNIYQENDNYKLLCGCSDVVGINIHPYFNPGVTCDQAGPFLSKQLQIIEDLCGKPGYVLEAGWPSAGQTNGKAVPGVDEQKKAIKSIEESEPGKVIVLSYRNDGWKNPGPLGVEQNFGCSQLF